ncbi:hypothetical protein [Lewinella sp. 4G2]|uniref:hypothetical protein n=1 Tax=Lewinella sp. 4G2 TaxID=1803372 RepID=UPI0007B49739|nr:hypothetical protein [Lewinella sp. 4G2]OAV45305.1 hypothetical protein A3850_012725 [Lewinella sp. 4G2]
MSDKRQMVLDGSALPGDFAVFDHFIRLEDMEATAQLLEGNNISVRQSNQNGGQWRENVIMGTALQPAYYLEIPTNSFAAARYLIREAAEDAWTGDAILSHPYADYTDESLLAILDREERYGIESAVVARNLLLRRGVDLELRPIRDRLRERQSALSEGREAPLWQVVFVALLGLASSLVFQPILLLFAAGMSLNYSRATIKSVNGEKYFKYGALTRVRGKWIGWLLIIGFILGLVNALYGHWIPVTPVRTWWWIWR